MSYVTNVVLHFHEHSCLPEPMLSAVNELYEAKEGHHAKEGFALVSDYARGYKGLETDVALGAFNYLDLKELIVHIRSLGWDSPESVQLFVNEQDSHCMRVVFPCVGNDVDTMVDPNRPRP